jgi:phosphoribosylglycinamide formyltransferase 1
MEVMRDAKPQKKRVGVLISGRGSNLRALVEASRDPAYPAEIVFVASNNPQADGLLYAEQQGISTASINHKLYSSREAFDAALNTELQKQNLDLICCAGFMRIMTSVLIKPWAGKMLNIHPSLLPLYKGLHTYARAIAEGARTHGASVHFVSEELDGGEVVLQSEVPVLLDDTPETLALRVLQVEHPLYVKALALVASGKVHAKAS